MTQKHRPLPYTRPSLSGHVKTTSKSTRTESEPNTKRRLIHHPHPTFQASHAFSSLIHISQVNLTLTTYEQSASVKSDAPSQAVVPCPSFAAIQAVLEGSICGLPPKGLCPVSESEYHTSGSVSLYWKLRQGAPGVDAVETLTSMPLALVIGRV